MRSSGVMVMGYGAVLLGGQWGLDLVEIVDEASTRAWLETQPLQVQVWFAARCALRAAPALGLEPDATFRGLVFASFRAMLISAAASTRPAPEMKKLRNSARSAAYSADFSDFAGSGAYPEPATHYASATARSAAYSAATRYGAHSSIYSADAAFYFASTAAHSAYSVPAAYSVAGDDADAPMSWARLWRNKRPPEGIDQAWSRLKSRMEAAPEIWGFWLEWYEAILEGEPLSWDLCFRIATALSDKDWDAGPEHVAEEIRKIRADWTIENAAYQETLELDQDTLTFSANPLVASDEDRLRSLLQRVDDAMDDVIALGGGNGLTQTRVEYLILSRLVRKYATDPERVAFDLVEMGQSITRQIDEGEYPNDAPMQLLQSAIAVGVSEIQEMDPKVSETLNRVYERTPVEPDEQQLLVLEEAMRVSAEMMDATTAETTVEDSVEILNGQIVEAPFDPSDITIPQLRQYRASVLRRQAGRLAQISKETLRHEKLVDLYESDKGKAIRMGGSLAGLFALAATILAQMIGF